MCGKLLSPLGGVSLLKKHPYAISPMAYALKSMGGGNGKKQSSGYTQPMLPNPQGAPAPDDGTRRMIV